MTDIRPFERSGYIETVVNRLVERGSAYADDIVGCSTDEIAKLGAMWELPLPAAYKEFLAKMGRCAGKFYVGTDIFYPKALKLREYLIEYQDEQTSYRVPADSVVFAMHQGYQVLFFQATGDDDPPVFHHLENETAATNKAEHFSEFLLDVSRDEW